MYPDILFLKLFFLAYVFFNLNFLICVGIQFLIFFYNPFFTSEELVLLFPFSFLIFLDLGLLLVVVFCLYFENNNWFSFCFSILYFRYFPSNLCFLLVVFFFFSYLFIYLTEKNRDRELPPASLLPDTWTSPDFARAGSESWARSVNLPCEWQGPNSATTCCFSPKQETGVRSEAETWAEAFWYGTAVSHAASQRVTLFPPT